MDLPRSFSTPGSVTSSPFEIPSKNWTSTSTLSRPGEFDRREECPTPRPMLTCVCFVSNSNNIDELKNEPTNQALTPYNYEDYAAWLLRNQNTVGPDGTTLLPRDGPEPDFTTSPFRIMNVLVPKEYILENIDEAVSLFPSTYSAFGGTGNELADDQCNAVSGAYRGGGDMVLGLFPSEKLIEEYGAPTLGAYPLAANDTFYEEYFPRMYDTTDPENFPAFLGSNHYGPDAYGPLKSDWTKACPVEWSRAKRDAECKCSRPEPQFVIFDHTNEQSSRARPSLSLWDRHFGPGSRVGDEIVAGARDDQGRCRS